MNLPNLSYKGYNTSRYGIKSPRFSQNLNINQLINDNNINKTRNYNNIQNNNNYTRPILKKSFSSNNLFNT